MNKLYVYDFMPGRVIAEEPGSLGIFVHFQPVPGGSANRLRIHIGSERLGSVPPQWAKDSGWPGHSSET